MFKYLKRDTRFDTLTLKLALAPFRKLFKVVFLKKVESEAVTEFLPSALPPNVNIPLFTGRILRFTLGKVIEILF